MRLKQLRISGFKSFADTTVIEFPGAVAGIVGPNGCGKSTLVKLASGLLRPAAGRVEVAGHDTASLASRERAHLMAVLAQSSRVPPMTVEALVACGRHPQLGWGGRLGPDDRAAVEAAMERAGVARFRSHDVHQLSGGERQRISIARAILKDAPIVLLDEATASLDVENESAVQQALSRLLVGKTVLVIAHRMRTVMGADHVVVLAEGRVAEDGTPAELLAAGGLFARMASLQGQSADWKL